MTLTIPWWFIGAIPVAALLTVFTLWRNGDL